MGIGLALVRQLVHLQGGTVLAERRPGRGSQFTVCLPLAQGVSAKPVNDPLLSNVQAARPHRILVVDDNVDAADTLQQMLRLQGHEVRIRTSGEEAIAAVTRDPPEMIFMDIGMPEMDGLAAARRIRAVPGCANVRIVAPQAGVRAGSRADAQKPALDAHLVKPVSQAQLALVL